MSKLPPEILKLAKKVQFVKGTTVPVYRLLDTLATSDGDISKIANLFPELDEPALREAFHHCAELLKSLQPGAAAATPEKPAKAVTSTKISVGESVKDARELLTKAERIKIYVDGSTHGNPGPSAFAVIIKDLKDNILLKEGGFIGQGTNNIAEARAIIAALTLAAKLGKKKIHLFSDSELMVKQIAGEYKIRDPELAKLHTEIYRLLQQFDSCQIVRIDRELNREADKYAEQILKQALAKSQKHEKTVKE